MSTETNAAGARAEWVRSYLVAIVTLAFGGMAARASSAFIDARFPDRPTPSDLLLRALPRVDWMQYVADVALLLGLALVTWYVLRFEPRNGPFTVALAGVTQISRAALNVLTPLATPLGNGTYWGIVDYVQNGMFPSGHTATALLFYLVVDTRRAPRLKAVMLGLFLLEVSALILARGHYSIDIIGGMLLAYVLHDSLRSGTALAWLRRLVSP